MWKKIDRPEFIFALHKVLSALANLEAAAS
jgi:hypothetical protein